MGKVTELVENKFNQFNLKYKFNEKRNHYQILIDYQDEVLEDINGKLQILVNVNESLGLVKFTLLLNGYAEKDEKSYKTLNRINSSIEMGTVYCKEFLKDKNKLKIFYRHTVLVRGANELLVADQFQLLIAYCSFVQDIVSEELGGYIKDGRKV